MEKFFKFDVKDKEKETLKEWLGFLEVEKFLYFFSGSSIVEKSEKSDIDIFVLDPKKKLAKVLSRHKDFEEGGSDMPGFGREFTSFSQTCLKPSPFKITQDRPLNIICVFSEELFKHSHEATTILLSAQLKRKEDRATLFELVRKKKMDKDEVDLFTALTLGDEKEIDKATEKYIALPW